MARAREHAHEATAARDRTQAADESLKQAKGSRLPGLSVQEIWTRTDSPAEVFALRLNQERFPFADFVAADPNRPSHLSTAISRVELSLPLYTGGELYGRISQGTLGAVVSTALTLVVIPLLYYMYVKAAGVRRVVAVNGEDQV